MFIRSMYFRDEEELSRVKEFIAQMRGAAKQVQAPIAPARKVVPDSYQNKKEEPIPSIMPVLPRLLSDVMNGLSYPNQEDLTREEQQILYDPAINGLVNEYRATKSPATALLIEERLKEIRG